MADISLIQDDSQDESEEDLYEQNEPELLDSSLCPLLLIEKIGCPDNVCNKRMVPQILLDMFITAPEDTLTVQLPLVMKAVIDVYNANGVLVKSELLKEIPNIALTAVKCSERVPELNSVLGEYLLPLVVRNLGVLDNQVRRAAHHTLFSLIQKGLITRPQAEVQICPTVLALSGTQSQTDYMTIAVMLMSRLAHFLGRDATERVFLNRFVQLCSSNQFYVRKMCASNLIYFCAVIGVDAYERILLPCYLALCEDENWSVRKSCAEVAVSVSCMCPSKVRHTTLAPVFARLLTDKSRWVRMSAFQALGPFISTFADPSIIKFEYNVDGEPYLVNYVGAEYKINPTYTDTSIVRMEWESDEDKGEDTSQSTINKEWFTDILTGSNEVLDNIWSASCATDDAKSKILMTLLGNSKDMQDGHLSCDKFYNESNEDGANISTNLDKNESLSFDNLINTNENIDQKNNNKFDSNENLEQFNSYNYWYVSPDVPLDPAIVNIENSLNENCNHEDLLELHNIGKHSRFVSSDSLIIENSCDISSCIQELSINDEPKDYFQEELLTETKEPTQTIVPQVLVDHFISLTDFKLSNTTDNEMAYHCAYSLPAVVLTLGCDNWYLLKKTVKALAEDMHYKVRRTVASSLHELALILGQDIATEDLVPLFEEFLKDLDEVRIGILKNLATFLKVIHPTTRRAYLPRLAEFLETENKANWRFRYELSEQLLIAVSLFHPLDASKYIGVLAQELLCDSVSAVREITLLLVTELIRHISSDHNLLSDLLFKLAEKFAHSKRWKQRQTFILLCSQFLISEILLIEVFASELMPYLLDLSWDPVANVRLVVARTISQNIITNEYFSDINNQYYDGLQTVLRRLKSDKDRDVRQCASENLSPW